MPRLFFHLKINLLFVCHAFLFSLVYIFDPTVSDRVTVHKGNFIEANVFIAGVLIAVTFKNYGRALYPPARNWVIEDGNLVAVSNSHFILISSGLATGLGFYGRAMQWE